MRDMLGREELITVEKALELLFACAPFKMPDTINSPIEKSYGMVIAEDIVSPEDLPAFHRSTVDGFAVHSGDTFGATENFPAYLAIKAEIQMGEKPEFALSRGEVARIATGGMLPEGADTVVMLEHTGQIDGKMIELVKPSSPGENVIQAGEDVRQSERVLCRGHRLRAQDVGALAGLGITDIPVFEKPRVSIISTGDEIVPAEKPVKPGQVRDINSYTLAGLISDAGGIPVKKGIFQDTYDIIKDIVEDSLNNSEMVLITGGSSVGTKDLTAMIINDMGEPGVLFHGVSLKPGKPMIGGVVNTIPVFGLPGHPAAVNVCFELFIRPVLTMQSGAYDDRFAKKKRTIKARLAKNISSTPGREEHIGVVLEEWDDELWAVPLLGKSGLITTLTRAEGTVVIPLRKFGVHEGETVEVRLF
ncbi:MAG: gephyrin-like molybdotransferase Glp [Nitrospirota bacterium]